LQLGFQALYDIDMSLWQYLREEVTRGYILDADEERYATKRQKIYTFLKVPRELEKFMSYGFFHCLDSFLFVFTFLPIRFALAALALLSRPILTCLGLRQQRPYLEGRGHRAWLYPGEIIDLLKGLLIGICVVVFSYIDTSMMYHLIKSQSVIKLYIIFNMLEVGDRLFSAFGQDTVDSLFWTATEPKNRKRDHAGVIPHFILTVVYVMAHTLLVLVQATCLNVAINASNKSLLTIMLSNNFIEIKGSVFKSFNKKNLFQVSCSDVRERFHLFALLFIVVVQTMKEYSWKEESFWSLAPDCLLVLLSEFVVDWIKHAFITRFNEVSGDVYKDYTIHLAYDLAQTKQTNAFADQCDAVSRRMGFMPLPLGVVMIRVVSTAFKTNSRGAPVVFLLAYLALLTFRMLGSVVILGKACDLIDQHHLRLRKTSQQQQQQNSATATNGEQKPVLRPVQLPTRTQHFQPENQASLSSHSIASKSKEEASEELKRAAVTLEAKIQTMFGRRESSSTDGLLRRESSSAEDQPLPAAVSSAHQQHQMQEQLVVNTGGNAVLAETEKDDRLMSIVQTSQQMAPFCSKLNSRPVPMPPALPQQEASSLSIEDQDDEGPGEDEDLVHKEPDSWSHRRSQLLAARQNFSDSRRRPLSCTPPSTSASQSLDDDENHATSATAAELALRQSQPTEQPAAGAISQTNECTNDEKTLADCQQRSLGASRSCLGGEESENSLGNSCSILSDDNQTDGSRAAAVESCEMEEPTCQQQGKPCMPPDQDHQIPEDNSANVSDEVGEDEDGPSSSTGDPGGFGPKALSSPDFLKTYRNKDDWPELSDEDDEAEFEAEMEAAEEDSNPEVDIDPLKRSQPPLQQVPARVGDSSRGSGGSGTLSRRKRCETVASPEQM